MKMLYHAAWVAFLCSIAFFSQAQIINTFPHTENFESFNLCSTGCGDPCLLSNGWTNVLNDQMDWTTNAGSTPTLNTGPDIDHNPGNASGKYLYTETSGCTELTTAITTPAFDLSAVSNFSFDFWYHMFGNTVPVLHFDITTDGTNYIDDFTPPISLNMDVWQKKTINLDAFVGDTVIIRLRGVTGNGATDMAVDDFTFYTIADDDAGISAVTSPASPFLPGLNNVFVTLNNYGLDTLTSADINWSVNGALQTLYNWTGSLAHGQTASVNIGTYNFPAGTTQLKAWTSNPNNSADLETTNDTIEVSLCTGLNGSYSIGGGGADFNSITDALNALYACGITGPVTFNITPGTGPYNGQLHLTAVAGASASNTITLNGNGETLNAAPTTDDRYIVKLNGAKHFILDNLNIIGTDTTFGWGVLLTGKADSNIVRNCTIDLSAVRSTVQNNSAGIVATATATAVNSAGENTAHFTAENNTIIGGYQGVILVGSTNTRSDGNLISKNIIRDFYSYGVFLADCDNTVISGNDISRGNRVNVGTFNGIHLGSRNQRTLVEKNKIHNSHGSASSLTGIVNGIQLMSCDAVSGFENVIVNNVIYDIVTNGTVNGIINSGSDGAYFYHNTISLDDPTSSNGTTRGFYQTATAANIRFKNNIVSVMRSGAGTKHCIYFGSNTSTIVSDYNTFFIDTVANNLGYFLGDQKTLALWQIVNSGSYDSHSIFANPLFVNILNNLNPTNGLLNGIGDSLGITTDITDAPRDASNPDPGAYEFTPPTADVYISWVSPLSPTVPGNKTVIVKITNSVSSIQTITDLSLSYTDGGAPVTEIFSSLNITPGNSLDISFTTQYNLTQYTEITAYINTANGVPDAFQSNDTTQQVLCPSLAGNYTIDNTVATGGNNFSSFTEAIDALSFCGIIAPVTFDVAVGTGPYTEQLTIPLISGTSALNTITINGNGNELRFAPTSNDRHIIKLNGAKYFTFNDLNITGAATDYGWGVHLLNAADRNTFNNCTIDLSAVVSTNTADFAGMVATNSSTSVTSNANNANYLTVENCTFIGGGYGIRINGSVSSKARGNNFSNNTIRDFYSYGIYLTHADSCHITDNDISRANRTAVGTFYGIYITTGVENTTIERNNIHNTHDNATSPAEPAYAVYFTTADAQLGKSNYVVNNLIYNINSNGPVYGIYNSSSDYVKYYHNSISLDDSTAVTTDETRGFYQSTTASGVEFKNNIITVKRSGSGTKHCIYLAATGSVIQSDHNVLLMDATGGVQNHLGRFGANDFTTFAQWQTANGSAFDQHSLNIDPQFLDAANGDLTPQNYSINNAGTGVGIATDYYLNPRNATFPDPGAVEFTPVGLDAAIAWVAPVTPISAGAQTVTVNISNTQTIPVTSLVLSYTDGIITETERFSGLSIAGGENQDISFTTPYTVGGFTNLYAYIDSVNVDKDANLLNDTTTMQVLCATLSGNFTVNKNAPPTATNFLSLSEAAARLSNCGISGPVVIDVVSGSGPYNEQVIFPYIFGSSTTNTITLNGNNETLTFAPTTDDRHLIRLNGTKHLTLNDLQITGTSTTYGYGIHFINNADSNTISGCKIDLEAVTNTVSDNSAGILFSGSTTLTGANGNNGNYNLISNSEVIGGYFGVKINGVPGSPVLENNFINNTIRDFYTYGFHLTNCESSLIEKNDISRANRVNVSTFYGVFLSSGNQAIRIERNGIHNTHDNASSLTGASYPINFSSCNAAPGKENIVVNNLIYNINSNGTIYGIYNTASDGAHYYHNSISLDNHNSSGGSTRGFFQSSPARNIDFRNNIVSIRRNGTGSKHCIYLAEPASQVLADYNIYYTDTTINYVGHYNNADYNSLADWQTADTSAYDQNSTFDDPVFGSIPNGNLMPLNSTLNDRGIPVGVTTDFNNAPRSLTTPDVGAYEFTPVLTDATVVSLLQPEQDACGSNALNLSAVITNFGLNPLSNVLVTANLSGSATGIFTATSGTITNSESDTVSLGTVSLPAGGSITLTVFTAVPNDEVPSNDTLVVTRSITAPTPSPALFPYADTVCKNTSIALGVIGTNQVSYYWYDTAVAGIPVAQGQLFITPQLQQDIVYYVEASTDVRHSVGPENTSIGTSGNFTATGVQGLLFDVYTAITLDSVSVFPNDTGTIYIELTDVTNTTILNITAVHVDTSGVKVTVPVGFAISPGSYRIDANGSTTGGLFYNSNGATYPYKVNGVVSITGNTFNPDHYYFFYDWKVTEKGCPSPRVAVPVSVNPVDTAVSATFTAVVSGLDVTFTPHDSNPNNAYSWNFGDNVTSTIGNISHQYQADGTYNACLTITNSCSQHTECNPVTVCGDPEAAFLASGNGLTLSFTYTGTGIPANFLWEFGDGTQDAGANPSHTFPAEGSYDVTLIIENLCGVFDTVTQNVQLCNAVTAGFTATPVAAGTLEFNFETTSAGTIVSYAWDFGDGETSVSADTAHTYAAHGVYAVTLIVTNSCGGADTLVQSVTTCSAVDAGFTATVQGDGKTVHTVNTSSGTNLTYAWDFGDSFSAVDLQPSHTYTASGTYTITLVTTDACGQTDTHTQSVDVLVGIGQVGSGFEIVVFPNPNDGKFMIRYDLEREGLVNLNLFNLLGEVVYRDGKVIRPGVQMQLLELNNIPKGVYFLEIKTAAKTGFTRVVIE